MRPDSDIIISRPERKIGTRKTSYETQKAATAAAGPRRADPMLLPTAPKPTRPRSRSLSSDSEQGHMRRGSFNKSRRKSDLERNGPPPRRARRDVYIPEYSRSSDRRSSDTGRRPASAQADRVDENEIPAPTPDIRPDTSADLALGKSDTPVIPQHEVTQANVAAAVQELQDLSDIEDIISLGGSDVETASLITPHDQIAESVSVHRADDNERRPGLRDRQASSTGQENRTKPGISIRGMAGKSRLVSTGPKNEVDLFSRISGFSRGRMHQDRLANGRSSVPQDLPAIQKYSDAGSNDVMAALMARLKNEKDLHQAVETRLAAVRTAEREKKLREGVLAIMAAKRDRAAELEGLMARLRERLPRDKAAVHYCVESEFPVYEHAPGDEVAQHVYEPASEPTQSATEGRQALLRAKIEKEKRLAQLKLRLMGEKENLRSSHSQ